MKERIHQIIDFTNPNDRSARITALIISTCIVLSIITIALETLPPLCTSCSTLFRRLEIVFVSIFTLEYVIRIWACTADENYRHPVFGRLRYALTPLVLIDLIVIAPFYISGLDANLAFLRAFRLIRLLRLAKLGRYSTALQTFARVLMRVREQLTIVATVLLVLLIVASSLMYLAESTVQPDAFGSIPAAMWWTFATFTTIGYGDVYPVTPFGRILAGFVSLLGIATFALPTAILGAAFSREFSSQDRKEKLTRCPHCGKPLEHPEHPE